jgi:hypothetical protein
MWIMISGPYTAGGADAAGRARNLAAMNEAAVHVFRRGHVPVIGVNLALPVIEAARASLGEEAFDAIMMPLSFALAERCDACLRIGGPSTGADQEAARFRARGLSVYTRIDDIPAV